MIKDVHTEHCCAKHGCKYSHNDCPVVTGQKPQSFPCEDCREIAEDGSSYERGRQAGSREVCDSLIAWSMTGVRLKDGYRWRQVGEVAEQLRIEQEKLGATEIARLTRELEGVQKELAEESECLDMLRKDECKRIAELEAKLLESQTEVAELARQLREANDFRIKHAELWSRKIRALRDDAHMDPSLSDAETLIVARDLIRELTELRKLASQMNITFGSGTFYIDIGSFLHLLHHVNCTPANYSQKPTKD